MYKEYETKPEESSRIRSAYGKLFESIEKVSNEETDVVVFTTNYDRVIEEFCMDTPQYDLVDGFIHDPRHRIYGWNPKEFGRTGGNRTLVKLFKLHGSLDWRKTHDGRIVQIRSEQRIVRSNLYERNMLIYFATHEKPAEEPFVTLYEHFSKQLLEADVLITIGFSYRDDHINDIVSNSFGKTKHVSAISVGSVSPETFQDIMGQEGARRLDNYVNYKPEFPKKSLLMNIEDELIVLSSR